MQYTELPHKIAEFVDTKIHSIVTHLETVLLEQFNL